MNNFGMNLTNGFASLLGAGPILAIVGGVLLGIAVGVMPGLSPAMGVALLVPFTWEMEPGTALMFLVAVYVAASYGGSITAITINTPGTPSAVVTAMDGHPMFKSGRAGEALGVSLVSSTMAGLIGSIILILFSVPLAAIAVKFHPAEYVALAILGLATVASLGGRDWRKSLITVLLGLLLATVGGDPISGSTRLSFGIPNLTDGVSLIPALIGMFALGEILLQLERQIRTPAWHSPSSTRWPRIIEYWRLKWCMIRSSLIGCLIGIVPGAGATIASFISYDITRRLSGRSGEFGSGVPEGIASAESANSGSVGGALVPLLTLGLPGSATTAVLIGAMMIHKLVPGPALFTKKPDVVYGLFASLLVANIVLLIVGMLGSRLWVQVARVPRALLFPMIAMLAIIGSFAVRSSLFDVGSCAAFGLLGWLLRRHDYPTAPVILGLVLGSIAELNLRRAFMMDGWDVFIDRPIAGAMLLLAILAILVPVLRNRSDARGVSQDPT